MVVEGIVVVVVVVVVVVGVTIGRLVVGFFTTVTVCFGTVVVVVVVVGTTFHCAYKVTARAGIWNEALGS